MENLDGNTFTEFTKGKFTVNKTVRPLSSMVINQANKQNNVHVKRVGGATRLLEDVDAF